MSRIKNGTYYLGRVIKLGNLDNNRLMDAIFLPKPIVVWGHAWTFIDSKKLKYENGEYVFARLIKYSPDAEVSVVDPDKSQEIKRDEPNLSVASSPFIYVPEFSGIAYLRVTNHIEPKIFMKRFGALIKNKYGGFFVECAVEPISDLRSFSLKLSKLDRIYSISATVSPPNPLFGPLWKDLKNYLEQRQTDRMKIEEESTENHKINTKLPAIVKEISEHKLSETILPQEVDIGDAAILMAADGYGSGLIKGKQNEEYVTIKTSETIKNFSFLKDATPDELSKKVYEILKSIKDDRHMQHDENH